jgi:hypothetical protein
VQLKTTDDTIFSDFTEHCYCINECSDIMARGLTENARTAEDKRFIRICSLQHFALFEQLEVLVKNLKAVAVALVLGGMSAMPALASDSVNDMAKSAAMLPVKAVGIGSAMVVGTPIAVTRQVAVRIRNFTGTFADNIGGKEDMPPNLFASFASVPAGTLVGTFEGLYYGPKNAVVKGSEKPFSVESFSLGNEIE